MTKKIKAIIADLLPSHAQWRLNLLSNWDSIMGNLKTKVHLENLSEDTITLGVYDSCWLQELYLLTPMLLHHINNALDVPRIKTLKFKKSGLRKNITVKKVDVKKEFKNVHLTAQEKKALTVIKDGELRCALEQFLIRCYQEK